MQRFRASKDAVRRQPTTIGLHRSGETSVSHGSTGDLKQNTVQPNGSLIADDPVIVWLAAFNQRVAVSYITSLV